LSGSSCTEPAGFYRYVEARTESHMSGFEIGQDGELLD